MADMQVADVRKLIDGLRWDRRRNPYSGRREYSQSPFFNIHITR